MFKATKQLGFTALAMAAGAALFTTPVSAKVSTNWDSIKPVRPSWDSIKPVKPGWDSIKPVKPNWDSIKPVKPA